MKFFIVFLFVILLLQQQVFAKASSITRTGNSLENTSEGSQSLALKEHVQLNKINCNHECSRRCSKAFKRKRCKRACKSCCHRCHCVPPGTYGNKDVCPCYARLKTHGNKPKCP